MNIVLIKHSENDSKQFLFEVPGDIILSEGSLVCVENKKGKHIGICTCDSCEVSESLAAAIVRMNGGSLPLAKVIGYYDLNLFEQAIEKTVVRHDAFVKENG